MFINFRNKKLYNFKRANGFRGPKSLRNTEYLPKYIADRASFFTLVITNIGRY